MLNIEATEITQHVKMTKWQQHEPNPRVSYSSAAVSVCAQGACASPGMQAIHANWAPPHGIHGIHGVQVTRPVDHRSQWGTQPSGRTPFLCNKTRALGALQQALHNILQLTGARQARLQSENGGESRCAKAPLPPEWGARRGGVGARLG
eukprot:CAMPEP_0174374688 /NCGR_PEP_ID=MMETSP0811_2-20130205/111809_1 /TAXON_ID=73025 ORGANISM="Eutreptiella gymnastica-like, Strain CCMP1594" /NCGR_SAMPLE_ID=MMETSP0811_2 /ASSEMBLY_ACC=CAM_ASM_000667 /LENGTH=148 /DNA_ID=CAMNT_0015524217 /DNA_START=249 /DNA_END=693 /DNA_ORIENTATION=-